MSSLPSEGSVVLYTTEVRTRASCLNSRLSSCWSNYLHVDNSCQRDFTEFIHVYVSRFALTAVRGHRQAIARMISALVRGFCVPFQITLGMPTSDNLITHSYTLLPNRILLSHADYANLRRLLRVRIALFQLRGTIASLKSKLRRKK